jgi:hypothetical protein
MAGDSESKLPSTNAELHSLADIREFDGERELRFIFKT